MNAERGRGDASGDTRHGGRPWEAIVEPDEMRQLLVVITAYPVDEAL